MLEAEEESARVFEVLIWPASASSSPSSFT